MLIFKVKVVWQISWEIWMLINFSYIITLTIIRHIMTSYFSFMAIYRVTEWYRVKERNSIRDNCEKLPSSDTFLFLFFLLIKSNKD